MKDRKDMQLAAASAEDEEAAAWVVRLDSDQLTRQDEACFSGWLAADDRNAARFEEALEAWNGLGALRGNAQAHEMLGSLYRSDPDPEVARRRWTRRAALGGGLAALAAALGTILIAPDLISPSSQVFETAKGEQRRIALADGSAVMLDTATRIRVALDKTERVIRLQHGQAYFNVAHDPDRPFRVFVGADEIRAVGTAFEVRFEAGAVRVILEEGRVAVFRGAAGKTPKSGTKVVLTGSAKPDLLLEPGQAVQLAPALNSAGGNPTKVDQIDLSKTSAWREGDLVFDDVPLPAAVAEVNRYGGRTIVLGDPSLAKLRVSGTFHTNRPEAFVEGVTAALPVRLQLSNSSKLILEEL